MTFVSKISWMIYFLYVISIFLKGQYTLAIGRSRRMGSVGKVSDYKILVFIYISIHFFFKFQFTILFPVLVFLNVIFPRREFSDENRQIRGVYFDRRTLEDVVIFPAKNWCHRKSVTLRSKTRLIPFLSAIKTFRFISPSPSEPDIFFRSSSKTRNCKMLLSLLETRRISRFFQTQSPKKILRYPGMSLWISPKHTRSQIFCVPLRIFAMISAINKFNIGSHLRKSIIATATYSTFYNLLTIRLRALRPFKHTAQ